MSVDPALRESFAVDGKPPRAVLIVAIETVFFHCAKAIVRAKLWDPAAQVDRKSLPRDRHDHRRLSRRQVGGEQYDKEAPARIKAMLY